MNWTINDIPDLTGKVIIVTGGNSGLGYESVKALSGKGAQVVLASRNLEKGETAKAEILKSLPEASIEVMALDLGDNVGLMAVNIQVVSRVPRLPRLPGIWLAALLQKLAALTPILALLTPSECPPAIQ